MIVLRFLCKTAFLLAMVFVFMVLLQYGPKGFVQGARLEWQHWQVLPASFQAWIQKRSSPPPTAESPPAAPAPL